MGPRLELQDAELAALASLLKIMVMLGDAPPSFVAKLSPAKAKLTTKGRDHPGGHVDGRAARRALPIQATASDEQWHVRMARPEHVLICTHTCSCRGGSQITLS
jgi:hypothetical protein